MARRRRPACPTEAEEQAAIIQWSRMMVGRWPELRMLYATNLELHRLTLGRGRALGINAGVPDLHLPVARGRYHGLWLEVKRLERGVISAEQRWWHGALGIEDHLVVVAKGAEEGILCLGLYLRLGKSAWLGGVDDGEGRSISGAGSGPQAPLRPPGDGG